MVRVTTTERARHHSPRPRRRGAARARGACRAAARRPVDGDPRPGRAAAPRAGRAAHRMGQVGGVLRGHRAAAGGGRGAHGHRLAAARADAQPDRRRGPGRGAGGHGELGEHRRLGGHLRRDRRRRGGRPAGQPGAAEQPRLPRPGAPPAHRERGSAGGGRGALRLGLGARLPARLPPAARADRRAAARGSRCWPPRRRRTTGWSATSPSSSGSPPGSRWCCAARWTARACGCRSCGCRRPRSGSGGSPRTWRSCPAPGSCTRSPSPRRRRSRSSCASAGSRSRPTPARPIRSSGWPRRRTCWRTGSRRWWPPARWAWGSTSRTSASSCTSARRPRPSPTTSRSAGPGARCERAEVVLLPGAEDRDIWAYFASLAFPPEPLVRRTLEVLSDRPLSTAAIETRVDLSRTRLEMLLKVLDSDGAVHRVKGGWVATGRAVGLRRGAAPADRHRPRSRAGGDARLPRHARVPPRVPAPAARRRHRAAVRALRHVHGHRLVPVGRRRHRGRGAAADQPARSGAAAAQAVAVGHGRAGRARVRPDPGRRAGRRGPGDRAAVGHRLGHAAARARLGRRRAGAAGRARRLRHGAGRLVVGGAAGGRGRRRVADAAAPARAPGPADLRDRPPAAAGHRGAVGPSPGTVGELRAAAGGGVGRVHRSRPRRSGRPGAAGRRRGRQRLDGHGASPACCAGPVPQPCCPFALALDA